MTPPFPSADERQEMNRLLVNNLNQAVDDLDIFTPDREFDAEISISQLRRGRREALADPVGMMTLVEVDGVLLWQEGAAVSSPALRRRRGRRAEGPGGEIVQQFKFEKLEPSKVGAFLERMDLKLTPERGLRKWDGGKLAAIDKPADKGRILLIVHGTFSNTDAVVGELRATAGGQAFLDRAVAHYSQVLTFDHPTISVSPVLNALDLARLFDSSSADVDVVCHSRGGLVTRWWMEAFDRKQRGRRAVLVGCPLNGTSLAAPPRLRAGLSLLTNVGRVLAPAADAASAVIPFLSVAAGLIRVLSSLSSLAAASPMVDAAVAMIPGLAAMSRIGNNPELSRLNQDPASPPAEYFAVRSNFEPSSPGWAFWRYFVSPKERLVDVAVDTLVFDGQNDLVVDTASMTELPPASAPPATRVLDFKTNDTVYHTNYFRQPQTLKFIADSLQIP